jgi:hypothetical protein
LASSIKLASDIEEFIEQIKKEIQSLKTVTVSATDPTRAKLFKILLLSTLLMSSFALALPWISPPQISVSARHTSLMLSIGTFAELPFAFILFGRRGVWFLTCLPFALYWPLLRYLSDRL